jgi:hypothetical protein
MLARRILRGALEAISDVAGTVPRVAHVDNEVGIGGHWQW